MRAITTPEGIELHMRLAGPVPRACAWAIDLAVRVAIMVVLYMTLAMLGAMGWGIFLIAVFLLEWLYPAFCEVQFDGATPGKKAMGLRVVSDDGTPIQPSAAVIRNLLRAVDFLPLWYGVGLASMLVNREFKRLGDLVAQTVVVYREELRSAAAIPAAVPVPPPVALTVQEARALLDYAERVAEITPERADELARIAEGVLTGDGGAPRDRLIAFANHLLGRASR